MPSSVPTTKPLPPVPSAMTMVPVTIHLRGDAHEVLAWWAAHGSSPGRAVEDLLEEHAMAEANEIVEDYLGGAARSEAGQLAELCGTLHWFAERARGAAYAPTPWRPDGPDDPDGAQCLREQWARLIPQLEATLRAVKGEPEPPHRAPVLRAVRTRRHAGRGGTR
jgi:hypothetical protein